MSNIMINKNNWNLKIDLNGGRIVELSYKNRKILGTFERSDGKLGNTHLCVPNFAAEGMEKYGWLFHGPFRQIKWTNPSKSPFDKGDLIIMAESLGLRVEQKFILEDEEFVHQIKIKNINGGDIPINLGIHNYWDCEFGWKGLKINGENMDKVIENSDYIDLKEINEIEIPGKKMIFWEIKGFKYAKLWVCSGDEKYVCIEPVAEKERNFGNKTMNFSQEIYFER